MISPTVNAARRHLLKGSSKALSSRFLRPLSTLSFNVPHFGELSHVPPTTTTTTTTTFKNAPQPFTSFPIQNRSFHTSLPLSLDNTPFSTAATYDYSYSSSSIPATAPFNKVLIANRGEIACRIIRTCKLLGIKTVAVYSTADTKALHVALADEAVCIGPPPSLESYLNVDAIVDAITQTGAEAVHPGYGFMSENSEFSQKIKEMGVSFVGPPAHAIQKMGDKITSKKIAMNAGVNTIPGYEGVIKDEEEAVKVANQIGYPVMIKATSGGGGKGMRIAHNDDEIEEGFRLSTVEAAKFFKDPRVFIEKYIENPHHIEFQILAGRVGLTDRSQFNPLDEDDGRAIEALVFPERECSIQRRNQKIIEESPSTLLNSKTRAEMVRQCKSLIQEVRYWSAGTVEFLVDEEQNFYFLEMNTRLQVEHPVTETVTGVDLVDLMLRVANEEGVPKELLELCEGTEEGIVPCKGHAIEARIYAEDPLRGFLPSTGPLYRYIEPLTLPNVRVDSGIKEGNVITPYYDPMISKLITYGETRDEATDTLQDALDRYVIRGVGHNIAFASSVCRNKAFREGRTPTSFIPTHYPDGFSGVELLNEEKMIMAAVMKKIGDIRRDTLMQPPLALDGLEKRIVMLGGMFGEKYEVDEIDGELVVRKGEGETVEKMTVEIEEMSYEPHMPIAEVKVDGKVRAFQILNETRDSVLHVQLHGASFDILTMTPDEYELAKNMKPPVEEDTSDYLLSPMPGTLISYAVKEGELVEIGQELCIVEAMKMQNVLRSDRKGIVSKLRGEVGDSVRADEIILDFETKGDDRMES